MTFRALKNGKRGQALVETALILPCVFLVLAVLLQLVLVIHMHMKLQQSAGRIAHSLAMGQPTWKAITPELVTYAKNFRWGIPVQFKGQLVPLEDAKSYPGPFSDEPKSCLAVADLSYALFGNWFAKVRIPTLNLRAHAEIPCEPLLGGRS